MSNQTLHYETVVICGGQAGLATGYCSFGSSPVI